METGKYLRTNTCVVCSSPFLANSGSRRYCSDECRGYGFSIQEKQPKPKSNKKPEHCSCISFRGEHSPLCVLAPGWED